MGYSAYYEIKTDKAVNFKDFCHAITGTYAEEVFTKGINDILEQENKEIGSRRLIIASDDYYKWYEEETEMAKLSAKFPGILFTLTAEGEENGDYWRIYAMDGKYQCVGGTIVYEPFSPDKLLEPED